MNHPQQYQPYMSGSGFIFLIIQFNKRKYTIHIRLYKVRENTCAKVIETSNGLCKNKDFQFLFICSGSTRTLVI